jgi:hypothetical protein
MPDPLRTIVEAMFSDIDFDDAQIVLKKLDLPLEYSDAAVAKVNAAANVVGEQAAELKRAEAPRAERLAVRQQFDRLVNARAFLYRLRPASAGDVAVAPAPVGGKA